MPYSALVENIMMWKTYLRARVSAVMDRSGVLAALLVAVFAAPAQAETLDAGALRAEVRADPFELSFTDARGRLVLGGGALKGGGERATDVHREGDALVATVG